MIIFKEIFKNIKFDKKSADDKNAWKLMHTFFLPLVCMVDGSHPS